jgi:predicted AAA+ superfamily ATPase
MQIDIAFGTTMTYNPSVKVVQRRYWLKKIEESWTGRSILWLSGVRRVGKTCLCKSLLESVYFDCELPRTRRMMEDPESFWEDLRGKTVVLDEIHRLPNPSEFLKIAADHFQGTRVLATGSSSLGASSRFKDTLTGRKWELHLTPLISEDLKDFGLPDLKRRLRLGGLPPIWLAEEDPEKEYVEWIDAYWAKDIQELFRLERRFSFMKFTELVFAQSGGLFEATSFSRPCEVSRTTISNYLSVLEATGVVTVLRPFSRHRPAEIISAPKVYGFDTGFVRHFKGWDSLREEDLGLLWEHFVLNEILGRRQGRDAYYWRDKRNHEVDFILKKKGQEALAVECKWSADRFDPGGILAFRKAYPRGRNLVVAQDTERSFKRRYGELVVEFVSLADFASAVEKE